MCDVTELEKCGGRAMPLSLRKWEAVAPLPPVSDATDTLHMYV